MSHSDTEIDALLRRSVEECGSERRLRCAYVRGHTQPHWDGAAETWLGLAPRCGQWHDEHGHCWRAHRHRGEHEGEQGGTWRRAK